MNRVSVRAQSNILFVSPAALSATIQQAKRPAVVQFWVPNCSRAAEILHGYDSLQKVWGSRVDFYFVGITNKPELIQSAVVVSGFLGPVYMADTLLSPINDRMKTFSTSFSAPASSRSKDWITLYFSPAQNRYWKSRSLKIKKGKLEKL